MRCLRIVVRLAFYVCTPSLHVPIPVGPSGVVIIALVTRRQALTDDVTNYFPVQK